MPTLVLAPRFTPDSITMRRAALEMGWHVERLASWRAPEELIGQELVLYAEPLFVAAVAETLGMSLIEPTLDWLPSLPMNFRLREIRLVSMKRARELTDPHFVKPAGDKCFLAKVYESGHCLPAMSLVDD